MPVILTAKALQAFDHDSSIPRSVKNRYMSGLWQSRPETPQIMSCLLMRLWTCDWMHLVSTRIKCSGNPFDISAFSCGIPAFVGNDYRHFLAVQIDCAVRQGAAACCFNSVLYSSSANVLVQSRFPPAAAYALAEIHSATAEPPS